MKKDLISFLLTLILGSLNWPARADFPAPSYRTQDHLPGDVSSLLLVSGQGFILPFERGINRWRSESIGVIAVPARGYVFSSWQPVEIFTLTEWTYNTDGQLNPPQVSQIVSPVSQYDKSPVLRFTPQTPQVLYDDPGVMSLTQVPGWQANFVPWRDREQQVGN